MMKKLYRAWRLYGTWGVVQNLYGRLGALCGVQVRRMLLFAHRLDEPASQAELPPPPFQELTLADFEAHRMEDEAWFTEEKMAKLARYYKVPGTRAYGCVVEGRLVAYGWVSEHYLGYSRRRLEEGDGYLWDGYTHPAYRGQGWHGVLIRIREQVLREAGKQRAIGVVAHFNRASRRGFQRQGYTLVERYRFGRRWGRTFSTLRYGTVK